MSAHRRTPGEQADRFVRANRASPVVMGYVHGEGGQGATYRLDSGRSYYLGRKACALLPTGFPKWRIAR